MFHITEIQLWPKLSPNGLRCLICNSKSMLIPDVRSLRKIKIRWKKTIISPFVLGRLLMLLKVTVCSLLSFALFNFDIRFEERLFFLITTLGNNREQLNNYKTTMAHKMMYIIIHLYYDCYQDGLCHCWNKLIWKPWERQLNPFL